MSESTVASAPPSPLAVAAVLLFSRTPHQLAGFYRNVLGLPLRPLRVPGHPEHWACELNHVYFAIWPATERSNQGSPAPAATAEPGNPAALSSETDTPSAESSSADTPSAKTDTPSLAGRAAVAFYYRDVGAMFQRLKQQGVAVITPPQASPMGIIARLLDPEGNPFELYQPPAPPRR